MGFGFGVSSMVKRLFCLRQIKEKSPDKSMIVNPGLDFGSTDFGSKQEMFFETKAWLDSDCEDDYHSVKGEFTPSRGSTPNRYFDSLITPQNGKSFYDDMLTDSRSEPSPTEKKKLAELLQDSLSEQVGNELNNSESKVEGIRKPDEGINGKVDIQDVEKNQLLNSTVETPKPKKEKSGLTTACCIPGLVPSISSRKQKTSPSH